MAKISPSPPPIGTHFGKTDLERLGYFAEMSYLNGGGYTPLITMPQIRDSKNKQMIPEFPKVKTTGLQDCYFDKLYKRLFIGEAYFDPLKYALKQKLEEGKKIKGLFRPTSYTHLQACRGDFFGCFTTSMKAFDPRTRGVTKAKVGKDAIKKFLEFIPSSPGKKGGYGYLDTTINPYPKYKSSPYEMKITKQALDPKRKVVSWLPPSPPGLFQSYYTSSTGYIRTVPAVWSLSGLFRPPNPTKSLGGCMDGCFDKWPIHSCDPYIDPWKVQAGKTEPKRKSKVEKERPPVWVPNGMGKTNFTPSVMQNNVNICTNALNWRNMKPVTYTREFI
ncbi:unnamed protein product [Nezara viridula]|uniref:Cilia-and flagella-associated protein 96 n=1 Tax=Nezara viridula TaxID=85310 RepID=A0A9P0E5W3_NEZVI|nr:unnamed protein product [Nezara viridula]